jgi:hypothetical protein
MGVVVEMRPDPLMGGFYSAAEAARILRVDSPKKVARWVSGYNGCDSVILADYGIMHGKLSLSFLDMMEVRFLEHFRKQGVPLQTLRRALVHARAEMNAKHPFALSKIKFLTDRRRVFGNAAKETGDSRTWELVTNQYEMYEAIEEVLAKGVAFDPLSCLAVC